MKMFMKIQSPFMGVNNNKSCPYLYMLVYLHEGRLALPANSAPFFSSTSFTVSISLTKTVYIGPAIHMYTKSLKALPHIDAF